MISLVVITKNIPIISCRDHDQDQPSFNSVELTLQYYKGNDNVKKYYEYLMNKTLSMIGFGVGFSNVFGSHSFGSVQEEPINQWSIEEKSEMKRNKADKQPESSKMKRNEFNKRPENSEMKRNQADKWPEVNVDKEKAEKRKIMTGYKNTNESYDASEQLKSSKKLGQNQTPIWSLHFRARLGFHANDLRTWKQFRANVKEAFDDDGKASNETEAAMEAYRERVHRRFERRECGKETLDLETRCLHHVISPLAFDNRTHELDFRFNDHILQPTVRAWSFINEILILIKTS